MSDPVTEAELHAYIDSQLDASRCVEVEEYLAQNPPLAARIMADMHSQHLLRLAFRARDDHPTPAAIHAARRLGRAFGWRRVGLRLRSLAACALLVGAGWFAHSHVGVFRLDDANARQAFVEDAARSHEAALIRSHMVSQRGAELLRSQRDHGRDRDLLATSPRGLAGDRYGDFPVQFRGERRAYAGSR